MTTEERQLGRARNALLKFFQHKLYIPKIYLNADWGGHRLDVLAIDRDGSGDVHAVLLFLQDRLETQTMTEDARIIRETFAIQEFAEVPAQYKHIVCAVAEEDLPKLAISRTGQLLDHLLAPDGMGRFGIMTVGLSNDEPIVMIDVKPERFRANIAQLADDFVENHSADWEIRA